MRHLKSVLTLTGTYYKVGDDVFEQGTIITDISIEYDDEPLVVRVWVTPEGKKAENLAIEIPYHAVELIHTIRK